MARKAGILLGDLPVPVDDGACAHLEGSSIPSIPLQSTAETSTVIDLASMAGLTIVFCYPRTGAPDEVVPDDWNAIPGARGCTPQACSFRDNLGPLKAGGVSQLFGLSTQGTEYQREVKQRIHLPYDLLSDQLGAFRTALALPTFEWKGTPVIRRLSLAIQDGKILKCWYPVFPPDKNVEEILDWLKAR